MTDFIRDIDKVRELEWEIERLKREHQWKVIETAPKDGIVFLYEQGYDPFVGFWSEHMEEWRTISGTLYHPTHWMPLPEPPEVEG